MKKKIVSCLLVGVMCTLIGSVAYADESGSTSRADSIKSHGTLLCEQADSDDEVYITSQDLINLANDVDRLEDLIDGLQCKDNPNIEYIYHYHHKSDGSASSGTIYSLSNPGGCYRGAGHTHDAVGACPSHTEKEEYYYQSGDCPECWASALSMGYSSLDEAGGCSGHIKIKEHTVYTCGEPTNTWKVQCGWRQGEIEKAEIVFSPN